MSWRRTASQVDHSFSFVRLFFSVVMFLISTLLVLAVLGSKVPCVSIFILPLPFYALWGIWRNLKKPNYYTPDDWEDR